MKFSFLLFLIMLVSCNSKQEWEVGLTQISSLQLSKNYVSQQIDDYTFFLDPDSGIYIGINGFRGTASYCKDGKEYKLDSLSNFLVQKKIYSSYCRTTDSIFLLSHDYSDNESQYLYRVDTSGKVYNKWFVINNSIKKQKGVLLSYPKNNPMIINADGTLVIYSTPPIIGKTYGLTKEERQSRSFFYKYAFEQDTLRLISKFGQIRDALRYRYSGGTFGGESLIKVNNHYLFSSSQDSLVRVYNEEGEWIKDIAFSTPSFKGFETDLDDSKNSIEYLEEYVHTGDYYSAILHYPNSRYIFRILRKHESQFNNDGTLNSGRNTPWAILVMDTSFKYLGQIDIPKDTLRAYPVFAAKKNNLLIRSINESEKLYLYKIYND